MKHQTFSPYYNHDVIMSHGSNGHTPSIYYKQK